MKLDIDDKTTRQLLDLAAVCGTAPEKLAADMLSTATTRDARYWRERAEDMAAVEAMKNGDFISQDEMFAKMDRLAEQARKLAEKTD